VKTGDVRRDKASSTVKELLSFAKENRKDLVAMLRGEVESQIDNLGLVTKRELQRLERRITRLEDRATAGGSSSSRSTTKPGTAKKSTAKKSTSKKSATKKKSTAKRSSAKKATSRRSTSSNVATSNTPKTKGTVSEAAASNASGAGSESS
jgi:DNA-binding protein HU-beta